MQCHFVNKGNDVYYLRSLLKKNSVIISKKEIETLNALKNLSHISNQSDALLIDRGDLSRYISIDRIPKAIQEGIAKFVKEKKGSPLCCN